MRTVVLRKIGCGPTSPQKYWLLLVLPLAGFVAFRVSERRTRQGGSLGHY